MNSKQIGNIGEAKVLSKFIELGFPVYIPFGDNEKAESTAHRKNGMRHKYTTDEVDYFALYNLSRDKLYLLKVPETPITTI